MGFWDHWVPGAEPILDRSLYEWAEKNKVDIEIDYITSQGDKLSLTIAAEAQAHSGHDVMRLSDTQPGAYAPQLEPVDDIVTENIKEHGKLLLGSEYAAKQHGHWTAVSMGRGTIPLPCCARIDMFKGYVGLDVTKMYPDGAPPDKQLADNWTYDTFLTAAEKCHKAGYPFGLPLSTWTDAANWAGAVFASYGSRLIERRRQYHGQVGGNQAGARMV